MKKTSTKMIIAVTAPLLLAIGAGSLFTHANDRDGMASASPMPDNYIMNLGGGAKTGSATLVGQMNSSDGKDNNSNKNTDANIYADSKKTGNTGKKNSYCKPVATHPKSLQRNVHQKAVVKHDNTVVKEQAEVSRSSSFTGIRPAQKKSIVTTVILNPVFNQPAACEDVVVTIPAKKHETKHAGGIGFAPELGINLNDSKTSQFITNGFHAGVMVNIGIGNSFAVQPGLEYITKGSRNKKITSNELSRTTVTTMGFNYVELPLDIAYKFGGKVGQNRFMVGAGPYVSYLAGAETKVQATDINSQGNVAHKSVYETTGTANMNRFDYGVGGFIGSQTPKGFYTKAGAEWGLKDVFTTPGTPVRNINYLITFGYILGSKNKTY
jgi:hypothetical protein